MGVHLIRLFTNASIFIMANLICACSAAYKIPISPKVGKIEWENPIALKAALLIRPENRNYIHYAHIKRQIGDVTIEMPVGDALGKSSEQAYSQIFQDLKIIQRPKDKKNYDLVIEPEFLNLKYRWVYPRYNSTQVEIKITVYKGEDKVWEKIYSGKEHAIPDTAAGASWEGPVGQTVSQGLEETLKANISDFVKDPDMRQVLTAITGDQVPISALVSANIQQNSAQSTSAQNLSVDRNSLVKKADFGNYHALIIGNDIYKNFPLLKTAVADAVAISNILKNEYNFKVIQIKNGTRRDILTAMDRLRYNLKSQDNLLIYYAGHGYFDADANRGYWLPIDAAKMTTADWISNADITDKLKAIKSKHVIVIADSCYSGSLTRGVSIKVKTTGYYHKISFKRSRTVLTSGGLEPVADSGGGKHSVFADVLLKTLRENDNIIDGTELFSKIRRPVMLNANQTPQYSDIRLAGHEGGDFLFIKSK